MKTSAAGKLLLLMLLTACMHNAARAQQAPQQGMIVYDMAVQLRKQMAKKNPAMAAMMPKEVHFNLELSFSKGTEVGPCS